MLDKVSVLCAVRDRRAAERIRFRLDDAQQCTIQIVSDGRQALEYCLSYTPDILVIDAVLPGMDGLGVVECLRAALRDHMPRVIGGAMMPFAAEGFLRRGAQAVVQVPWREEELLKALTGQIEAVSSLIDWAAAQEPYRRAAALLHEMGMKENLKGFGYLAWAAALAYTNEARLFAVGKQIYAPIAGHADTTPQNVERLIRHAVESTMDAAQARGVYSLFGNTIDPSRGKPTNAQAIGLLVQRMRVA